MEEPFQKKFFGTDYSAKDANNKITLSVEVNGIPHAQSDNNHAYYDGGFQGGGMLGSGVKSKMISHLKFFRRWRL